MFEYEWIGEMPVSLQHWARRADWTRIAELDFGDHAASEAVIELFDEQIGPTSLYERKRISIEAQPIVRQDAPAIGWVRAQIDQVGTVHEPPADAPMR